VTRAEIEQVRGVGLSKGTLDLLFEQNWIRPMGRRRAPGKPVTWGTSDFFLEHFGLPSLDDLPGQEELKAAGLLDPRSQPPIFRPEEPDLPLEPSEDEADEPLAVDETGR
jgi:segregation and condensation protein B